MSRMNVNLSPIKRGTIVLFDCAVADIPGGWAICSGANGTPNLVDMFIRGTADPGLCESTGGAANHTHDFASNVHQHLITAGSGVAGGTGKMSYTSYDVVYGTTQSKGHLPPWTRMVYIMKL